mgnify:CR=1 FL=1
MVNILMYTSNHCPYCSNAEQLLKNKGFAIDQKLYIDQDADLLSEMMEKTGKRTVPQIFIGDTNVGGCDELYALDKEGKLDKMVK